MQTMQQKQNATEYKFVMPTWEIEDQGGNRATLRVAPLERTLSHSIGNALRRSILEMTPGAAPTYVRIEGAPHDLMVLDGVVEDVLQICQNLTKVRPICHTAGEHVLRLDTNLEGAVRAGDLQCPADVEIANPDLYIATISSGGKLTLELYVQQGRGYEPFDSKKSRGHGFIPLDSLYSPVKDVVYQVNATRLGQELDYEELVLTVETDGSVAPSKAISHSLQLLASFYRGGCESLGFEVDDSRLFHDEGAQTKEDDQVKGIMDIDISYLNLGVRAFNALRNSNIITVKDLVQWSESELLEIRGLGVKSLQEIKEKIAEHGLSLAKDDS